MLFLVGTNHELQHDAPAKRAAREDVEAARKRFKSFLQQSAARFGVVAIGEEFAEEILSELAANSLCQAVAAELSIKHIFFEPSSSERLELGVPAGGTEGLPAYDKQRTDAIREEFWLRRLRDLDQQPVLFVCGADHVKSFTKRLVAAKIRATILCEYWGKEVYAA